MVYLFALWLLLLPPLSLAGNSACPSKHNALVVSLQGKLFYSPAQGRSSEWQEAKLNDLICENSRIKLDSYSRATLKFANEIYIKLGAGTIIALKDIGADKPTWLNNFKGFIHVISRTPKKLTIETPIANAGPEGTEFAMSADDGRVSVWVYEGGVRLYNREGEIKLKPGEAAQSLPNQAPQARIDINPQDAVNWALYYLPVLPYPAGQQQGDADLSAAINAFRQGKTAEALNRMENAQRLTNAELQTRAAMQLTLGQADLAEQDIQALLGQNPKDAQALALKSILALTQNRKDEAYALANQAVAADSQSSAAYSAQSYAEQSRFDLDKALKAAEKAATLTPHDALVWARKAELQQALGLTKDSQESAKQAVSLDANLERTQTVLGFAHLNQMDTGEALAAFNKAITLDSTSPLARLGLGLTKIRDGDLAEGRQDMEIAAMLDPNNSLVRSYLGKAYYEERRSDKAEDQFNLAKQRDPKDPTPYFYDALKKQSENRPVEALHDLQKAMELNDNRAVYRSKQLLDSDRAARGASLARIYNDLGFQQRGVVEAISSLQTDPTNYSAHRFLSDTYVNQPGRETAQLSELLQAKMLQPININPVQPHLSVSQRGLLTASGIANSSFQDFTRVFEGNRPQLLVSGVAGNQGILGDEAVLSGIYNNFSYSLGQFHYSTDGFKRPYGPSQDRNNTQQKHNIYDAFIQWHVADFMNLQFEYIHRENEQASIRQRLLVDRDSVFPELNKLEDDIFRIGLKLDINSENKILGSFIHKKTRKRLDSFYTDDSINSFTETKNNNNFIEAQYLNDATNYNLILGFNYYSIQDYIKENTEINYNAGSDNDFNGHSEYFYINLKTPINVAGTLGLSHEHTEGTNQDNIATSKSGLYPKLGVIWNVNKNLKARFAYFRGIKKRLESFQTLEPTQISGFNQFFDDLSDKVFTFYGGAIDIKINDTIFTGFELTKRKLFNSDGGELFSEKDFSKIYFNWTLFENLVFSTEYRYLKKYSPLSTKLSTHIVPIEFKYFSESGFFGKISGTYINQAQIDKSQVNFADATDFFLVDSAIGYRLPNRLGIISLECKNLLNKKFKFEDLNGSEESNIFINGSEFIPQRTILGKVTLNF